MGLQRVLIGVLLGLLALPWPAWSVTSVLVAAGTPVRFDDTPGAGEVKLAFQAIAAGAGRSSAVWDRGAGALTPILRWECSIALTGTLVTTEAMELWRASSQDNTVFSGRITADAVQAAATYPKTAALRPVASMQVSQTTTNTLMTYGGIIWDAVERYQMFVFWNRTSFPNENNATNQFCVVQPMQWEIQN